MRFVASSTTILSLALLHCGLIIITRMSDRLEQLNKLYAVDATDPFITYALAMEHIKAGELDEAMGYLDETIQLDATYAYAYYQKALVFKQQNKLDEARAVISTGIAQAQSTNDAKAVSELNDLLAMLD